MKNARLLLGVIFTGLLLGPATSLAAVYQTGDVFASIGNGQVGWYRGDGTFVQTLNTGAGGITTGSTSDSSGNFYVTNFSNGSVYKFDNTGTLSGTFVSGLTTPESILFDASGNAYVGQADGNRDIYKFSSTGTTLASYNVSTTNRGSDWIDLAADQSTMFYTSEGNTIKRFNVSTSTSLTDFATGLPGSNAYAFRLLSDGGLLVADTQTIVRLNSAGVQIQSYDFAGQNNWFALNLDPDGTSFWSGDFGTGQLHKFDIATGLHLQTISTGSSSLFGVSVFGEITQGGGGGNVVPEPSQWGMTALLGGVLVIAIKRQRNSLVKT